MLHWLHSRNNDRCPCSPVLHWLHSRYNDTCPCSPMLHWLQSHNNDKCPGLFARVALAAVTQQRQVLWLVHPCCTGCSHITMTSALACSPVLHWLQSHNNDKCPGLFARVALAAVTQMPLFPRIALAAVTQQVPLFSRVALAALTQQVPLFPRVALAAVTQQRHVPFFFSFFFFSFWYIFLLYTWKHFYQTHRSCNCGIDIYYYTYVESSMAEQKIAKIFTDCTLLLFSLLFFLTDNVHQKW